MLATRRRLLFLPLTLALPPRFGRAATEFLPRGSRQRVVIVGGGWAGLTAARQVRTQAPKLEVVLVEPQSVFWSAPLSNRWLVGLMDGQRLNKPLQPVADRYGYLRIEASATSLDREQRTLVTDRGLIPYDWLVLSTGIRQNYAAWFSDDQAASDAARNRFPAAFNAPGEFPRLKQKLDGFKGGDWVMTIPPLPYRCPPAPYERTILIAWWLKSRGIPGKLHVLDPNPPAFGFDRIFRQNFGDQINYLPQATVKSIDPYNRVITTDFDSLRFDEAILMPPQQAGSLVQESGLAGNGPKGRDWADIDPVSLQSRADERIFLAGDLLGSVSPLFGHYPKTGQMASRQGKIVADQIAAQATGREANRNLPDSTCHVLTNAKPFEAMRIETRYRFRGDGLIMQTVAQSYNPQPDGEDIAWAEGMFGEFL